MMLTDQNVELKFSFIHNSNDRRMYESAYRVVCTYPDGWKMLQNFDGKSFMFDTGIEMAKLVTKVNESYFGSHSGCSLSCVMRTLEFIAKYGFETFQQKYLLH